MIYTLIRCESKVNEARSTCNWIIRQTNFESISLELATVNKKSGNVGEERWNWRNGGGDFAQQVWTHSSREEGVSFGRNSTSRGRIAGPPLYQDPSKEAKACPSFRLASAQLNSTLGGSFHKSRRVPSTRYTSRVHFFSRWGKSLLLLLLNIILKTKIKGK